MDGFVPPRDMSAGCRPTETTCHGVCIARLADGGDACPPTMCAAPLTACGDTCANLQTDSSHCGLCGIACRGGASCTAGHCVCPAGQSPCSGMCVDLTTVDHCGSCTNSCGSGGTCSGGHCTACGSTHTMCPGGTACIDTMTNAFNCGSCGHVCTAGETCVAGMCSCGAPRADCGHGCTDVTTDIDNCGACGNSCGSGGSCIDMICTCGSGSTMCGAGCADLTTSHDHCGDCAHACGHDEICMGRACVAAPLYHGWTCPIVGCSTTSYTTTSPTVLGGMYPYNVGDTLGCRAWKLAATVCTTMPTMYSGPDNWQCTSSGGFTDPRFGTYCLSPAMPQYSCSTCPGACNATCAYRPLSLRDCTGRETDEM